MLELPLPRPDPITPPPAHDELRRENPVARVGTVAGPAWLVTSADLAVAALSDPRLSVTPPGVEVDVRASLFQDGPAHARLRRLVAGAFRPARIAEMGGRLDALASSYVDRVVEAGPPVDLVDVLAAPLPVAVIGDLVGISRLDEFRVLVDAALAVDPMTADPGQAWSSLGAFVESLVAERRAVPADDLLGDLIAVRDTGDGQLSDEELVALVQVLVAAGALTTRNALVQAVVRSVSSGRFASLPLADVSEVVEDVIRRSGVEPFPRFAVSDLVLGGMEVAAGSMVLVSLEAANHDPDRTAAHLGFGHGPHYCLGAALARAQLCAVLPVLARRLPGLRLDVPVASIPWFRGFVDQGPVALPVSW